MTNAHDYNRDGRVDAIDQVIARNSAAAFSSGLELISAPATAAASPLSQSPHPHGKLLKTKRRRYRNCRALMRRKQLGDGVH